MSKEAMKLALEALNNSVDLVVEDAYNAEKLYGNYPSRQAKVGGLKVLAENHKQAIKAIEAALEAHKALTKQEQELDPVHEYRKGFIAGQIDMRDRSEEQSVSVGEPVAWGMEGKDGFIFDVICPAEHEREEGGYTTPLYTTPQQRKPKAEQCKHLTTIGDVAGKTVYCHDCETFVNYSQPAQPKQEQSVSVGEPVAWINSKRDMTYIYGPYNADDIPLYTTPQPIGFAVMERPLVGLTGEQKDKMQRAYLQSPSPNDWWLMSEEERQVEAYLQGVKDTEAAHGITQEKNT